MLEHAPRACIRPCIELLQRTASSMMAHAAATNPTAPMYVYGMELPAATALVAMLAVDVLVRSSRGIDYACHAGGALFGLAFYEYYKLY